MSGATKTFIASAAIPARRVVAMAADGTVAPAAAGARALGASTDVDFSAGAPAAVILDGVVELVCAAAFDAGVPVAAAAGGKLAAATAEDHSVGVALEAGAVDAIIRVHLRQEI